MRYDAHALQHGSACEARDALPLTVTPILVTVAISLFQLRIVLNSFTASGTVVGCGIQLRLQ